MIGGYKTNHKISDKNKNYFHSTFIEIFNITSITISNLELI